MMTFNKATGMTTVATISRSRALRALARSDQLETAKLVIGSPPDYVLNAFS
ncbi:MAG: hypothetical protein HYX42_00810 [Polaromonas sp.]|uniref:hypothetical protein n=1 Tax=Polaromonas sp. TaxID=1869339 RepID=UPI0025D65B98|nr:hypothetical protein [Polaromonas sp.]MBI2724766.1 hypothetical protein [Polaromonas sp.]